MNESASSLVVSIGTMVLGLLLLTGCEVDAQGQTGNVKWRYRTSDNVLLEETGGEDPRQDADPATSAFRVRTP